ncbi:MAG: hypothetical protein RI894_1931, partial [Bacteroidota bacterium]
MSEKLNSGATEFRPLFSPKGAVAFRQNEDLKTVFDLQASASHEYALWWNGTPIDEKGAYMNLGEQMKHDFRNFIRWQFGKKPQKKEKKADNWRHSIIKNTDFLHTQEDGILWLGHATYFLRINGLTLLIDPV